jgi:hypothetical protein
MAYGTLKVDNIIFTNGGVDQTITVSGIVASTSGNLTATGTISGAVIRGGTLVSGATVTGAAGQFTNITASGISATTITGTTVTGTTATFASGIFTTLSGGTQTVTSGVFALGTAAAPSISFATDSDTGIYSPGAEQVAISTNAVERVEFGTSEVVFNDGGENYDFRIEGDTNANLFFVDASTDRVGIGTTSPASALDVSGDVTTSGSLLAKTTGQTLSIVANPSLINDTARIELYGTTSASPKEIIIRGDNTIFTLASASEVARIDSSGRLLVGTSTARGNFFNITDQQSLFEVETVGGPVGTFVLNFAGAAPGSLVIGKTRGTTSNSNVAVQASDGVGRLSFQASDGSEMVEAANIECYVDGTPGANDMPGRLVFSVTADGASSPTEAMRIKNSRIINIANTPVYADNAAAKTGGLVDGDVYRKSDGTLMIVYT